MNFEDSPVNVRIKLAAAWTSIMMIFAYVDIFMFYRADFRDQVETGKLAVGFKINQAFLLGTTIYVAIPSLMILGSMILPARINRIANIALAVLYALTIIAGAFGEWRYYQFGSALEVILLAAICKYAWKWPQRAMKG
jgi:Family of unknown function (DUF6326)